MAKIFIYPTDTIYGLGCNATDRKSVQELFKIKKRDINKPMIVLVSSYCMLKKYFFVSKKQEKFLRTIWTKTSRDAQKEDLDYKIKSTTVILKSRGNLAKELLGDDGSGAVRFPYYPMLIHEMKRVDAPIVSTSLNISGQKTLENLNDIEKYFGQNIPVLFEDLDFKSGKSSQIIDLRDVNKIKILR